MLDEGRECIEGKGIYQAWNDGAKHFDHGTFEM